MRLHTNKDISFETFSESLLKEHPLKDRKIPAPIRMEEQGRLHQGSVIQTLKFKVDNTIILDGVEMCISKGPVDLLLNVSESRFSYQRSIQSLQRVFRAENDRDACLNMQRIVHLSFEESVLLKENRNYNLTATLKSCELFSRIITYRSPLNFDGVCLVLEPRHSNPCVAVFTALTFRNIHNSVRRKIPITI